MKVSMTGKISKGLEKIFKIEVYFLLFQLIARLIRSFFEKIPKGFRRKILDSWCYPMCRDRRERYRGEY
jgi:hypothetical protein